jgi:hypothetical protein
MRLAGLLVALLLVPSGFPGQAGPSPVKGTIFGTAVRPDGRPARGIGLAAFGLHQSVSGRLPHARTDEAGKYRFENLDLDRYAVQADDEQAGYSIFATWQAHPAEVQLTAGSPMAELRVDLPPPAGFLHIHLTNRRSGAVIPSVQIRLTLADAAQAPLYATSCLSDHTVLIPSGILVLLHVVSEGFHEWAQSAGTGKRIEIPSGVHRKLNVQLEPRN